MPNMNGPDVCEAVRGYEKSKSLPPLPIIILSGNNNEEFVIECMLKQVTRALLKPITRLNLNNIVKEYSQV
jgi:CheY-like chemotaxis protein